MTSDDDNTIFSNCLVTVVPVYSTHYYENESTSGTAPIDSNVYFEGDVFYIKSCNDLLKSNFTFSHWNTQTDGTGTTYLTESLFTQGTKNLDLYAQWIECTDGLSFSYFNGYNLSGYSGSEINIIIPEKYKGKPVRSIDSNAFKDNSSITSVFLPNTLNSLGYGAFHNCESLITANIPTSITQIESFTFSHCSNLASITIPNSITKIDSFAFEYCSKLTTITIPASVTILDNYALANCTELTSVTLPNSLIKINEGVFAYCTKLTSIIIPENVTIIGHGAFQNSGLTSLIIPSNVTYISDGAFFDSALTLLRVENTTPPLLGDNAIPSNTNIKVPSDSVSLYKTATGWSNYADNISGY
ncbi:leucine-rich repeat domain-containing protein [Candidatus Margulisiibacteriota bacterium]